jgi:hypothetical protein
VGAGARGEGEAMSRGAYSLRTWLLRAVSSGCGPAPKNVLRGIARRHGLLDQFEVTFRRMLDAGELVMYGERKAAVYGTPKRLRA